MAVNARRLLEIVHKACQSSEERYPGYRSDVEGAVAEVLSLERQHRQIGTQVRRKILDQCVALGDLLARQDTGTEDAKKAT